MLIKKWEKLPKEFQIEEVKPYYEMLRKKNFSLFWIRVFDILASGIMLLVLLPFFLILSLAIVIDSRGPVFFRQERVTQYGKKFKIFKFRTMYQGAEAIGSSVTTNHDVRVTRVGRFIRKCKIDELSQLIDVFRGKMSFVGTRPEIPKYVRLYKKEYLATLLLPAGITSMASIMYKDENSLLEEEDDPDETYIKKILPEKMRYNLKEISKAGFFHNMKIMFMTFFAVLGKNYEDKEND